MKKSFDENLAALREHEATAKKHREEKLMLREAAASTAKDAEAAQEAVAQAHRAHQKAILGPDEPAAYEALVAARERAEATKERAEAVALALRNSERDAPEARHAQEAARLRQELWTEVVTKELAHLPPGVLPVVRRAFAASQLGRVQHATFGTLVATALPAPPIGEDLSDLQTQLRAQYGL